MSETLARFVAFSEWTDIDAGLRHEAKRSLLNFFGCALAAASDPAVAAAAAVMRDFSGPARLTVIGRRERLDAMGAAFVNAIAANLLDYDDTHLKTVVHPTAPVAPAALALAEQHGFSGVSLLHAFIVGAEVECRIGSAVSPGHYARGWHITSTCGVFGAAAACGKLLGLTVGELAAAIGIAASQSAGLVENLASAAKNVGVGNAARNGLLAALLARAGYMAAAQALEGPLGWARAMGDAPAPEAFSAELGTRWEYAANTYKPYPAGIVFHAVIDACLELRKRFGISLGDLQSVTVRGDRLLLDRGDRPVTNARDARVSIHHCAAVAFVRGRAGVEEFEPPAVTNPAIVALRRKVYVECDPSLPSGGAIVIARAQDGRSMSVRVDAALGSVAQPLSDRDLEAKFRDNAARSGGAMDAEACIAAVWTIEEAANVIPLLQLMAGA
ncbi:MAG TPA: MmgE/PrpD family protein [Acetobacteraceae bacterium]|nr:MmgE/PrpD family protein [Acetobacteraceae bacterium]